MARVGKINSPKQTENGALYFGNKDKEFLKQKSREAVEKHNNISVLYFKLDWELSKRNFYGEMTVKKFKNSKGVEVLGSFKLNENDADMENGLPNKTMSLIVSVYVEQLKELGISPDKGDYFAIGKRIYQIYNKTLEDVGPGNLLMGRERIRQDFYCHEETDESIQRSFWSDNEGLEKDIRPGLNNVE